MERKSPNILSEGARQTTKSSSLDRTRKPLKWADPTKPLMKLDPHFADLGISAQFRIVKAILRMAAKLALLLFPSSSTSAKPFYCKGH